MHCLQLARQRPALPCHRRSWCRSLALLSPPHTSFPRLCASPFQMLLLRSFNACSSSPKKDVPISLDCAPPGRVPHILRTPHMLDQLSDCHHSYVQWWERSNSRVPRSCGLLPTPLWDASRRKAYQLLLKLVLEQKYWGATAGMAVRAAPLFTLCVLPLVPVKLGGTMSAEQTPREARRSRVVCPARNVLCCREHRTCSPGARDHLTSSSTGMCLFVL